MKRPLLIIALAALTLAACNHSDKEFSTRQLQGRSFLYHSEGPDDPYPIYEKNSYSLLWPHQGLLSDEALHELMILYFDDSSSTNIDEVASLWLNRILFSDEDNLVGQTLDTFPDSIEFYSEMHIESTCEQDNDLAVFHVNAECYSAGAAHGLYTANTLTVDKHTGRPVHLDDLVSDTSLLSQAVARAIQDLDINKDVRECLFDEYIDADRMPMPTDFFIDSARTSIVVGYGLYHITPYACGIPYVVLPIYWLSKHVPLSPYAKRLFGPGSYLPDPAEK